MARDGDALLARLRELALVDVDALTTGVSDGEQLVADYLADLRDALEDARTSMAKLEAGSAPAAAAFRALDDPGPAEQVERALSDWARDCRELARLADAAAGLVSKVFDAHRRGAGSLGGS